MANFTTTTYDFSSKTWSGIKKELVYGADSSVGEEVMKSLLRDPDHISQICYTNGKKYTNRDIANLSICVAQHFQELQFQQCQVVGICASNSDYVAPLFFGAMLSGLTVNTLDTSFDKDGIKHIYSITKPSIMFCDGSIYGIVKEAFNEINLKITIYTMKDHIEGVPQIAEFLTETGREKNFKPEPLISGSNQTAAILCSSGTTGLPKGVCISHASILASNVFNHIFGDTFLTFSTLYWISGLQCLIYGTIEGATRVISEKGFDPKDFIDIIEQYKVTGTFTTPSQMAIAIGYNKFKSRDLSSLQYYLCGGSAVPYSLVDKLKLYMPSTEFLQGYGMTEIGGVVSYGPASPTESTGQLTTNIEVKIINSNQKKLGPDENGEICIRKFVPWSGYYKNPHATAVVYIDGWIHSGDVGYFDKEGNLHIIDRMKEILKYNNYHFSPSEIESVIHAIDGVTDACVYGIPDDIYTHLPAAAIVKTPGSQLTESEVYNHVAEKMAHFKHLRGGVFFLDELPKTASGKILRRKVSDLCSQLKDSKK